MNNSTNILPPYRFSIAPMMDWSDRHCRYFWRLLTREALLYTEMVTTGALLKGDFERFLQYNQEEHPLAIQLGGSDPRSLAKCAGMAEDWGYDEVNLNCGCPSDRVQEGKIGAILMAEPELVAECVSEMRNACSIPITVKHRIGIDDQDDYPAMADFVRTVAAAGCSTFIVHARKAWLKGLSPKQNREVPPLNYDFVAQLKREFPTLTVIVNGGINTIEQSQALLEDVDGVMIGREAYNNPWFLAQVDEKLFNRPSLAPSRDHVITQYAEYCQREIEKGNRLHHMSRHILGLYLGEYGARIFRRHITECANRPDATAQVLLKAVNLMKRHD
ncbi:tRNA dihydrouridine(20/20a) synthase DusA [Teredinibacter haidensis]|uniref:tRNA dihydrouridine(20/20a) synthase DusA n=1 Tax=Teredinibacter haidensis TaxID=2731755 RepID=UPI000948A315|nr:tRNA dihydrouridine(20/20a) synthase DusA [Teredinibacter haidensis]